MALTTSERTSVATSVWSSATRTLTSFGTLIADIWAYTTRIVTAATNITSNGSTIDQTKIANLDATITSRASQTSLDTVGSYVDTEVAAIKAKTDNIPNNPSSVESVGAQISSIFP
jgi:hypothetical protein